MNSNYRDQLREILKQGSIDRARLLAKENWSRHKSFQTLSYFVFLIAATHRKFILVSLVIGALVMSNGQLVIASMVYLVWGIYLLLVVFGQVSLMPTKDSKAHVVAAIVLFILGGIVLVSKYFDNQNP